ncbi:MAG TPA: UbiA family prenyltransferase [Pyrinomonadaceae bacterium]|jgi:4-hydroxybenzoate polyprenyltransferase|nr:UbiA family prenyltransferase [Pyrinomonadaceae bacterium]
MLRYLVYMLRIRRVEFRIAEIPILAIPLLILLRDTGPLKTFQLWEGVFIFFLLFAFGDMINCLADRDLDAVYKPHLSEAVYGLGVRFVTFQVIATAALALVLSFHLSLTMNRWLIFVLVAIGLVLGAAYSVKPVQLKGRGLAQLICLWLIIFVGPMMFVSLLVEAMPSLSVLVFAAAYGTIQMGIILINTAEDYPEDLNANITTSIVSLGLHRGIGLAFWLVVIGALGVLSSLIWMLWQRGSPLIWLLAILPAIAACVYVTFSVGGLRSLISGASLDESIRTVKHVAKQVPLWVTIVAWSVLGATYALFCVRT